MKVLQVHTRYRQPGGEDTVVSAEAELLRSAGHQVVQVQAENPAGALPTAGALVLAPWNPRSADRLARAVEQHRPDVAHVHNTWFALSPSIFPAIRKGEIPVVMTLHNYRLVCSNGLLFRDGHPCEDCVGTHPWHGVVHRCYRDSVAASTVAATTIAVHQARGTWSRQVDLFLALTEFSRGRLVAGGLPADRVIVKPNFTLDPGPRSYPPSTSRTLLFAGRLSREKGVDMLLRAWATADTGPLELVVIGDGPMEKELREAAPSGVRFLGRLSPEALQDQLLRSRALVFPSRAYETQGMVIVEALAAGVPVLASDLGAVPETVTLGPDWLVAPGDLAAWAEGLERLCSDELVDQAGTAARSIYEGRFSPSVGLANLEAAYRRVV
jgi:glycosyltransferase involved in cell wall biosynthesis